MPWCGSGISSLPISGSCLFQTIQILLHNFCFSIHENILRTVYIEKTLFNIQITQLQYIVPKSAVSVHQRWFCDEHFLTSPKIEESSHLWRWRFLLFQERNGLHVENIDMKKDKWKKKNLHMSTDKSKFLFCCAKSFSTYYTNINSQCATKKILK